MASGALHRGRVGIVYPRGTLDSVPSLCNSVELLARRGYVVDVFAHLDGAPHPIFDGNLVVLHSLGAAEILEPRSRYLLPHLQRGRSARLVAALLRRAYRACMLGRCALGRAWAGAAARTYVRRVHRDEAYRCFIGVDPDGLLLADALTAGCGVPAAYYSLELLLSAEVTSRAEQQLKRREIELSRRAPFVIVQDEQRGRLLAEDNGLAWERLVLVPNAPLGPARRMRSSYWAQQLGLSPEQRIVLHSGSLGDWTGIESIISSVAHWPPGWVLVIHTRYNAEASVYIERLRALAGRLPVFFSLNPVGRQDYARLVDGADVGIAFYVPSNDSAYTQRNVQTIGLSSGKIAYCARAGLPVIVNSASTVGELVERAGCGVAVREASEIGPALERVASGYAGFSDRARAFFDAHLNFERSFEQALERIDALGFREQPAG